MFENQHSCTRYIKVPILFLEGHSLKNENMVGVDFDVPRNIVENINIHSHIDLVAGCQATSPTRA